MQWLTQYWAEIIKLLGILLTVLAASGGSVKLIDRLKGWLGFYGVNAQILAYVVQATMAIVAAVVGGQIVPEMFTSPVDLLVLVVSIVLGSNQLYNVRKRN